MSSSRSRRCAPTKNRSRSRRPDKPGRKRDRRRLIPLGFETLENRLLLAADAFVDAEQTLQIIGTASDDQIVATVDSVSQEIVISTADTGDSQAFRIPLDDFQRIQLDAAGGNDFVNMIDADFTLEARKVQLDLSGGDGENIVFLSTTAVNRDEIQQLVKLANLGSELEEIATQLSAAAQDGLVAESQSLLSEATSRVIDVTETLQEQTETELIGPAHELLQLTKADLFGAAEQIIAEIEGIGARAGDLSERMEATEESHLATAEAILQVETQRDAETDLEATSRMMEDAAETFATQATEFADEGLALADEGSALGDSLESLGEKAQQMAEHSISDLETRAADMAARAEQLETDMDQWNSETVSRLQPIGDRVMGIAERLQGLKSQFQDSLGQFTEDLIATAKQAPAQKHSDEKCAVKAKHTYHGGSGTDVFFPLSAPWSSWSINGSGGNDILFGGFAADEIKGGDGTDLIFGLRGNDLIHGNDGTDFLFGEFAFEIPLLNGDDCVFGDAGIDLVVGDNGFELFSSAPGGDDHLHGGDSIDIVIGDDISDIFDPNHAGGSDELYGDDGIDVMFGTGGDDTLEGGAHIDFMSGGGDNDTMYGIDNTFTGDGWTIPTTSIVLGNLMFGNLGNDTMYGGDGLDVQFGNDGEDEMYGKDYIDVMFGQADNDTMYGESGGELFSISGIPVRLGNVMFGNTGEDEMWGGGDLDVMFGNTENDTMHGYDGNFEPLGIDADVMLGGDGDDTMFGDAEELLLLTSTDWMFGQNGNDIMHGGKQVDWMFGGSGADTMHGDSNSILLPFSTDFMFGNAGDDTMDGGNGLDLMFGNDGADIMNGDDESLLLISPDLMFGNAGDDTMNGGASADLMFGNAGDDTMLGDSNVLWFVASTDLMFGNAGNDIMDGGNAADIMFGNSGDDRMSGDNNSPGLISPDLMFGNSGDDWMNGGNSADAMFGGVDRDTMLGDDHLWWQLLSTDLMFGGDNCDKMFGGTSNDLMFGNGDVDKMDGQRGLDIMFGNASSDHINGGDGWDILFGNSGTDVIHGNDGWDIVSGGSEDDRIFGDNGWDVLLGNSGNDLIHGNNGWDVLFGNSDDDCLHGDNGWDTAFGNSGDDCIYGGNGWDSLRGNSGDDHLFGDAGRDTLRGNSGDDNLEGGTGWDRLRGNSGDDNLWGGAGVDNLNGGSGNDNLWGGSGWPDILIGGPGSDSTSQGGPDASGITCVCVQAPVEPCVKYDFGDAPDSYGTLLTVGARHKIKGPRLGNLVDWELNGQPSPSANADDLAVVDDEDGVTISTLLVGATTVVPVNLQNVTNAFLNVWVDNNADGDFSDLGEHVSVNYPITNGTNLVNIALPATAQTGASFARFRVTSDPGIGATGEAMDGEVEDYQIKIVGWDYGDAPDVYGTTNLAGGARHFISGPFLGMQVDGEGDGQPSPLANGDDMNGVDDEDGVTLPGMIAGTMATATVDVGPTPGYLNAWIDFNGNGSFDDSAGSPEIIADNLWISGTGNTVTYTVPVGATTGATYARFRISTAAGLGPLGTAQNGEVEDYRVYIKPESPMDYGDAPDSYQTFRNNDGPRHQLGGPIFGPLIDAEPDGQPSMGAVGDDANNLPDEGGITLTGMMISGTANAEVELGTAAPAFLDAWIDFDGNGDFTGTSEQIFSSEPIVPGINNLPFPVPATAIPGPTYARFRVSSTGGLAPTTPEIGPAPDGEVQDFRTGISQPITDLDYGDAPDSYGTLFSSNGARHISGGPQLGSLIDMDPDGQPTLNADGDDTNGSNDEDGVTGSVSIANNGQADVTLSNATTALLYGWMDFNQDGSFDNGALSNEVIFNGTLISSGANSLSFAVPNLASLGETYARFRVVSTASSLAITPIGYGGPGEVEDYLVVVKQQLVSDDDDKKSSTADAEAKPAPAQKAMPHHKEAQVQDPALLRTDPKPEMQSKHKPAAKSAKTGAKPTGAITLYDVTPWATPREEILYKQFSSFFASEQAHAASHHLPQDQITSQRQDATTRELVKSIAFLSSVDELVSSLEPHQVNSMLAFSETDWLDQLWKHHTYQDGKAPNNDFLDQLIEGILG